MGRLCVEPFKWVKKYKKGFRCIWINYCILAWILSAVLICVRHYT